MILKFFLAFWLILCTVITIATVGQPRKAVTPAGAAIATVINLGIVAAIFAWWPS